MTTIADNFTGAARRVRTATVEKEHFVAVAEQRRRNIRSDKSGSANQENAHARSIPPQKQMKSPRVASRLLAVKPTAMRVRIKTTPDEREIDGVQLKNLAPGSVHDVSSSIGSWLIAQGYAAPEMRRNSRQDEVRRPVQAFAGDERRHSNRYRNSPPQRNPFASRA